ncbi:MAG: hypothetical protein M0R80_18375 [Proteobacteria bacterium]|nr:hypothetical protein [Pseudomonadota bacterium]
MSKIMLRATLDFAFFIREVFSQSFDKYEPFIGGDYLNAVGFYYQNFPYTSRISARDHFKSTGLYAKIMWDLLRDSFRGSENHYFSYRQEMSSYHLAKVKELIRRNPFYAGLIDHKPLAEGIMDYSWGLDEHGNPLPHITIDPQGLLTFKRGIHCRRVYIDDPLKDPENKLNPTIINKINRIIFTELLDMPSLVDGECHIVGTPQTWQDFFFDKRMKLKFKVWIQPAIISEAKKIVLWPEWRDFDELVRRRELRGVKIFNQEYMCKPVYSENSFFEEKDLLNVINPNLKNWSLSDLIPEDLANRLKMSEVLAGLDIGKKVHPSHFVIFYWDKDDKRWKQIHQKFMDGWDYFKQVEYCDQAIKFFNIDHLYYDNTRGEFEGFKEQGKLSHQYHGVVFNTKTKNGMASTLQKLVNNTKINERGEVEYREIELIDDFRQFNQILAVDNDLEAMESPEGHGDSFWSIGMALQEKPKTRAFESKPEGF